VVESLDDIKQSATPAPTTASDFSNIYERPTVRLPARWRSQLANPIEFLCGAVQAASRMFFLASSRKTLAQYMAPIVKNASTTGRR